MSPFRTKPVEYVTLSHRWGSHQSFVTTKANLESRQEGFYFEELPQTYRDAAIIAARLGFEYLWIDALCIVQDDPKDWIRESGKMGAIYHLASLTIASHCSENDGDGFLAPALQRRGGVPFSSLDRTYVRAAADLELDISRSPLAKRGWVFQERFLSARVLHFTTGMIYLETPRWTKSEDAVDRSVAYWTNQTLRSPLEWFQLVEMYSTCSLTREQDKLIAISGIAQVVSQGMCIPYLSGIWADRLAAGLMWLNVDGPLKKSQEYRASTWSWAAWDGPIQF
ncbi:HET-domain-containing protein, partial [Rhizodiscina lignyota]